MVHHFLLLAKLPLGHASVSFNHNNTAFPCFDKGFRFWLSRTKALYIHLKTINESIQIVSLIGNYACHPSVNSRNPQSLAVLTKTTTTPGNTSIIVSLLLTQFHLCWLWYLWVDFGFPSIEEAYMKCHYAVTLWIHTFQNRFHWKTCIQNAKILRLKTLILEFLHL